jgi:hypothetical protein
MMPYDKTMINAAKTRASELPGFVKNADVDAEDARTADFAQGLAQSVQTADDAKGSERKPGILKKHLLADARRRHPGPCRRQ